MNLVPSSLRNRLVLGAALVGLAFAVLFGALAAWRVNHAEEQAVTASLHSRMELARDEVAADGSLKQDAGSPKTDLVQVLGPDGETRASSPSLSGVRPLVEVGRAAAAPGGFQSRFALQRPDVDLAVLAVPLRLSASGDSPAGTGALVVATDAEGFNAATADLLWLLVIGLVMVVLAMAGLAWVLTGRALVSVTRLTENAESVQPRDLASGLPVPRRDAELTRMVVALNRMLARLHQSHATELAFAADAGHRLRTPVATLRAEAELALRETDPDELVAALRRVVADADQLAYIVDRMLARSRAHSRTPEPVLDVLGEASSRWHRQAALAGVTLTLRIEESITPATRCAELAEIVDPIIDNAVRHTPLAGCVDVDVRLDGASHSMLQVTVANTGEPVPDELAPHVFDAWVSSRDATVAGGLGLWLARESARDLGGDVTLVTRSSPTTFRVRLSVSHAQCDLQPERAGPLTGSSAHRLTGQ